LIGARMKQRFVWVIMFAALVALTVILAACSSTAQSNAAGSREIKLAPASQLSSDIQNAPSQVREAYQFALANADLMKQIPCYCGCGSVGHTSNLDCYIKEVKPDGTIVFDQHALG
jgi:outer membrane murein-binding lipoprotein Lpp